MKPVSLACLLVFAASGCTSRGTAPSFLASDSYQGRPAADSSLFAGLEGGLGGVDIERILSARVVIPDKSRLAIMRFGQRGPWLWWSEEFSLLDQNIEKDFIKELKASPRLLDVSLLPSMMTPQRQTVPTLRLAAARYQADLLLVYRSSSRTFRKQRWYGAGKKRKAQCVVEAILLDVRTGLVPFTSVSVQAFETQKSDKDYNVSETMARAEMKVLSKALHEIGQDLIKFLSGVPKPPPAGR